MGFIRQQSILILLIISCCNSFSQTWVDSLDNYTRKKFLPASKYIWSWQHASILYSTKHLYYSADETQKSTYLNYIKKAMDRTVWYANGKSPNAVASGLGMALLAKELREEKYVDKSLDIYEQYLQIRRTGNGGVSHLKNHDELWDDTIFMIGQFLLGMYETTQDEKYLSELIQQIDIHKSRLQDNETKLWVHGWDEDGKGHCTVCGDKNWANQTTHQSAEFWGRGNGWIVVTLSDILRTIPKSSTHYSKTVDYLTEMIQKVIVLQDEKTGHW